MEKKSDFLAAVQKRRSIYGLGNKKVLPEQEVAKIVRTALKHAPTAFNSQSSRVVLLLGKEYQALWQIVKEELKKIVPADKFAPTESKINSFAKGLGTILFFEDQNVIKNLQEKYSLYKENFPVWSEQSNGMLQYIIWTALEEKGLGASLQHYNPLIDEQVKKRWNLPVNWKLIAQMPFGSIAHKPDKKEFAPLKDRLKICK